MNANQRRRLQKEQDLSAADRFLPVTFLTMHKIYHWNGEKYMKAEKGVRLILGHDSKRGAQEYGIIRFVNEETGLKLEELMPGVSSLYMELYGAFLLSVMANFSYSQKALEIIAKGFMKYHKSKRTTRQLLEEMSQYVEVEVR